MAHPVRLRMLSLLTGAALSATEVADELGISHATASYHLRALQAAGLLAIAEESAEGARPPGRPSVRYRHVPGTAPSAGDADGSRLAFEAMVEDLRRRHGAMRAKHLIADGEVWLPREAWEEVCRLSDRIADLVHEHATAPRARGTVHASVTVATFEL
ncbi:MAG TPA: helix-turn-helix domain-containing protein [Capillimicrobium sp.]|nr:helix-turn-helix domain-containing protein [Capillimicrobium sp.]